MSYLKNCINKFLRKNFKGLTMVEVLATIIVLSLIILALISTAYYIFLSFEEISIKGVIRRKVDEYYHSHIFTKYYLYNDYLGTLTTNIAPFYTSTNSVIISGTTGVTNSNNPIEPSIEFTNRLNNSNIGINLASLLKDMIVAFNSDDWVKSQGIQINSVSATILSTLGFYKIIESINFFGKKKYTFYLVSTLDKIKIDFSFQKRNKHQFNMSFNFYIVNNMKNKLGPDRVIDDDRNTDKTLNNGPSVFSITTSN